jgi:hypothetical protein
VNDERGSSELPRGPWRTIWVYHDGSVGFDDERGVSIEHDVPEWFTREDAEALMDAVCPLGKHRNYDYEGLAARIAALLPPDQSP